MLFDLRCVSRKSPDEKPIDEWSSPELTGSSPLTTMIDIIFVVTIILFFVISCFYVRFCDRI